MAPRHVADVRRNERYFSDQPRPRFRVCSTTRALYGRIHPPLWNTGRSSYSDDVVFVRTDTEVLQSLREGPGETFSREDGCKTSGWLT